MKNKRNLIYLLLHVILVIFSLVAVCSKIASTQSFMSRGFILAYGAMLVILGLYAIAWQQIIKRVPLTMAYANRAVTVIWGMIWGMLFFSEQITPLKIIGCLIIIAGIILFSFSDQQVDQTEEQRRDQ
ncbi:MAG: transporter [Clostridia bacterium]|nr:transporter [Clostridia bacterium]